MSAAVVPFVKVHPLALIFACAGHCGTKIAHPGFCEPCAASLADFLIREPGNQPLATKPVEWFRQQIGEETATTEQAESLKTAVLRRMSARCSNVACRIEIPAGQVHCAVCAAYLTDRIAEQIRRPFQVTDQPRYNMGVVRNWTKAEIKLTLRAAMVAGMIGAAVLFWLWVRA